MKMVWGGASGRISDGWWRFNKYIIDMSVSGAKTKRIGKHYFRLVGRDNLYFKGEHVVAFTPLPKSKAIKNRSILPKFNHDRKFYTYAFHLPSSPAETDEQLLEEHEKRAAEALLELSEFLIPKPRSRHKYCGVCRGHYEDYKEHVDSQVHLTNLTNSRYQQLINQLCASYQKKEPEEPKIIDLTAEEVPSKISNELTDTCAKPLSA